MPLTFKTVSPLFEGESSELEYLNNVSVNSEYMMAYVLKDGEYLTSHVVSEDGTTTTEVLYTFVYTGQYSSLRLETIDGIPHYEGSICFTGDLADGNYAPIYYTDFVFTEDQASIETIDADTNAPVEYFNIQGIRVENPTNGLYIRRQGSKVSKVLVK